LPLFQGAGVQDFMLHEMTKKIGRSRLVRIYDKQSSHLKWVSWHSLRWLRKTRNLISN